MTSARSEGRQASASAGGAAGASDQRVLSARKEPAPIVINKDEQFLYKAPSSIHETVVNTLRREKDSLSVALSNQRESANSMAARMTQMGIRMAELEKTNEELLAVQAEDKNALAQLDVQYRRAADEAQQLRAQVAEGRLYVDKARDGETKAFMEADAAVQDAQHSRDDVSFLTKETQRLADELKRQVDQNLQLEDQLGRARLEFEDYKSQEHVRLDVLHRELDSLNHLKDVHAKDLDELRQRADGLQREKIELTARLDRTHGDQDRVVRDRDGLQEQAQYYQTENADLRDRMQGLANQNRDLEMRLSRALTHLDSRSHPGNINSSSYNVNESAVDRSRDRAASGSAHDVYENVYDVRARSGERTSHSPLRPALAARSPSKELSNV